MKILVNAATMLNIKESWIDAILKEIENTKLTKKELLESYNEDTIVQCYGHTIIDILLSSEFWDEVEPFEDCESSLKRLQEKDFDIAVAVLIPAGNYMKIMDLCVSALRKHFPFIPIENYIIAKTFLPAADAIIDDNVDRLNKYFHTGNKFLYNEIAYFDDILFPESIYSDYIIKEWQWSNIYESIMKTEYWKWINDYRIPQNHSLPYGYSTFNSGRYYIDKERWLNNPNMYRINPVTSF